MSKMVIVCSRNTASKKISKEMISNLFAQITPQDYNSQTPQIEEHNGILLGIYNPTEGSWKIDQQHAYIGSFFDFSYDSSVGGVPPDGSFFLTRYNKNSLELVADSAAMYTMWHVITPELFIASSSQRIIVSLLGNFELNAAACHFLFCRGALGIGQSWDKRIDHMRGREQIVLNRNQWRIESKRGPLPEQNTIKEGGDETLLNNFKEEIINGLQRIKIDWTKYIITLSGGYDSRMLYMVLKDTNPDIRTASWTNVEKMNDPLTDGYIAKQLTDHFGTEHAIHYMDIGNPYDNEKILNKYLEASEGMIDHIGAYMDGMRLYEDLRRKGISGFVRGTQVFGTKNKIDVAREQIMRDFVYLDQSTCVNRDNMRMLIPHINNAFGIPDFPAELEQKKDENLFQWGERMWIDYTGHVLFGALNGIKLHYIDIIHPYMSREIIESCWQLPDHLRADFKSGFRKVVQSLSPSSIPFAKDYATPSVDEICRDNFKDILYQELKTESAKNVLSKGLVDFIIKGMETEKNIEKIRDKHINPSFIRMAFRGFIILKMKKMLTNDALDFKKSYAA